ncbi:MAG TPA: hypothetical protein VFL36_04745 [Myxococcales bacterium]|nr:hypothetical protein [Myxococcales bacterium]
MDVAEAKRRVEEAVGRILLLPAGVAELGFAMFVVDRSDAHCVGRREALELFNERLDRLDAETQAGDAEKSEWAREAMAAMVISLECAGRGEYRRRDTRA